MTPRKETPIATRQAVINMRENRMRGTEIAMLKEEWKLMEDKHTLLRSVAGSGIDQIDNLEQNWDRFELMLDSHQLMIKDQVEVLKTNVETNVKNLKDETEKLKARWDQFKPRTDALQGDREQMLNAIKFIKEKREQWKAIENEREKIEKECAQFNLEEPNLEMIDELNDDIKLFEDNWLIYDQFSEELEELAQEEWIVFRSKTYLFDEFLQKWTDRLKESNQTHMGVRLMKDIDSFKEFSSCLKFCRGDVLSADHWHEMFRFLGLPRGTTIEKLKFSDLISVSSRIIESVDKLRQLNSRAQGEVAIRDAIQELSLWAAQCEFTLTDYKHSNGQNIKIIKDWKEVINSMKDCQALLQSLKSSPYYSQFTDKTSVWETRLTDLDIFLSQMNEIQRKWIYLEPIFGRGSLPSEASRFARVDSEYRAILNDVSRDNRVVSLCSRAHLKKSLEQIVDQLNRCQKALNQFLEQKRQAFPRFYFIGDDDLLEILGQSTNPIVIQSHMKKLFQGIECVQFSANNDSIISIISAQGETVQLLSMVKVVPQVELWLQNVSDEMQRTLKELVVRAVSESSVATSAYLQKYPSQVLCLADEIRFCQMAEKMLGDGHLEQLEKLMSQKLETYTQIRSDDPIDVLKLKSLILDTIHQIDIVAQLKRSKNQLSIDCWEWQRQLRYYLVNGKVIVRQVYSEFDYTYEYQGNYAKLVHTPLTDKCYLTLTQAMYMGLGGNPYGPAGTGKTESVKALAALMGRQVLVFNCDEGIDVQSMSRIFTGIVECGAWGCFDEFNRLDSTVLSAVSTQIQTIQTAIKTHAPSCVFASKTVKVNPNSAIFVTLNPAGKGYGGRQKLPDNLKQLFRAVVMRRPDNELIAATILSSDGFKDAGSLARKIVTIFDMSRQMLSRQQHYDWGLRALKVVLGGCGSLKRQLIGHDESKIVVEALLLNTLSKLTASDARRFHALIDDVFGKEDGERKTSEFEQLVEPLANAQKVLEVEASRRQLDKVHQLYEQLRQRIGVVIVGPSGSGKSTIWNLLKNAIEIGKIYPLNVVRFNPKAVNRNKLLGYMDMDTREWTDGIITMAARQVIKDTNVHHWIVCDGDIDPEWIEALNSVLDDNRLLTMPSGERIRFGDNVNFIFETDSLRFASPATVSRMGMIYVSSDDLDPKLIVDAWIRKSKSQMMADNIDQWMDDHFFRCFEWSKRHQIPDSCDIGILRNALSHIATSRSLNQFLVALYNGLAPFVVDDKREELARDVIFTGIALPDPSNIRYDSRVDSIGSYTDDITDNVTREQLIRDDLRPLILTADAQKYCDIITSSWLENSDNRQPFIISGPDGSGKRMIINDCVSRASSSSQLAILHCSSKSDASHLLHAIQENCVQASGASGRVWKPKDSANLVIFLKRIDLPLADQYGSNELLCFLQQLLAYSGFYDENLEWIAVENIQFVASMSNASAVPARVLSLMRRIVVVEAEPTQVAMVYQAYLSPILEDNHTEAEIIATRMVDVFEKVRHHFKTNSNILYKFTLRDLTKWVVCLARYDLESTQLDEAIIYEARRVFADRLSSESDAHKFDEILAAAMPMSRSGDPNRLFISNGRGITVKGLPLSSIPFKDYFQLLAKSINRFEFEIANFGSYPTRQFVEFCAHVDRCLSSARGHLFLAGRSGFGRRDAVRLVAHMHDIPVFVPQTPSSKHLDIELKQAVSQAISEEQHVLILVEDHHLTNETSLQRIDALLASGYAPKLFSTQELDGLASNLADAASLAAFQGTLRSFLADRIRSLVHVVIMMDLDCEQYQPMIEKHPAIVDECNVIMADRFDRDSLMQLPKLILEREKIESSDAIISGFTDILIDIPNELSIQPARFKQFISNYVNVYQKKKESLSARLNRLETGVAKLNEAKNTVAEMQAKAAKKSRLLAEKQAEADEALKAITESMSGAEDQKISMEQLKEATAKENERIEEQKAKIDEQLKEVQPMIDQARKAVGSIKSESLSEIRSLRAPPEAVRDILQAVLLFMGILDTSWEAMRKFLSKTGVKDEIMNFDSHRITPETHKKVSALMKQKAASFEEATAKRASVAAAPLAAWVKANLEYAKILEKISPLESEKNKLMKNLKKAEKQMNNLSRGLESVDQVVADLKQKFENLMKEATQIKLDLEREQDTIKVAGKLVDSLSSEFERWQSQIKQLGEEKAKLETRSLISSAFLTYLGNTSEKVRDKVHSSICRLLNTDQFDPVLFVTGDTERLNWKTSGLPSDALSMQNAMIVLNSAHVPLIIDPTGNACQFLLNYVKGSERLVAAQPDLTTQLELAMRFGKTVVVDAINEFDARWMPIIRKELSSQGPRQVISFVGKMIDYNPDFRLFLCARDESVKIAANASNHLAVVNFSTTTTALAAQLLAAAIKLEKPDLEERSSQLLRDTELNKVELEKLEELLLQQLATAQGNLLDNTELLDSLNKSKQSAETIGNSIKESEKLHEELEKQREIYVPLSQFAASLFFTFSSLHLHNQMYNYSVNTIMKLFDETLKSCQDTGSTRISTLARLLQIAVFTHISRGIFRQDRLMFALIFIRTTMPKVIPTVEWELFIGLLVDGSSGSMKISWIGEQRQAAVSKLRAHLPAMFNNLQLHDEATWNEYSKTIQCENSIPSAIETKLTAFQKVLLIQSTRPDRLYNCLIDFVKKTLSIDDVNPPAFGLEDIYKESNSKEPILLVLADGADPTMELIELANRNSVSLVSISMGQGQQKAACEAIRNACNSGSWVCLNNVHLMMTSLPDIQKELAMNKQHENFRLWMTAEPDSRFPTSLLQQSMKITFEPPPGIKNNLLRTYSQIDRSSRPVITCQTIFVATFLHALLQERRTFIPQGWTRFYEFSSSDARVARAFIEQLTLKKDADWKFIGGILKFVVYGGRIESDLDSAVLDAYISIMFNSGVICGRSGRALFNDVEVIASQNINDYIQHVNNTIPPTDDPKMFGLPDNIKYSWQIVEAERAITSIRKMHVGDSATSTDGDAVTPIINVWKKVCTSNGADYHKMQIPSETMPSNAVQQVLELEFINALQVVHNVHNSLKNVAKSARSASQSASLKSIIRSLVMHQTPEEWFTFWSNGPSDPVDFLNSVIRKTQGTHQLLKNSKSQNVLSNPIDLSDLFEPIVFLNAVRQETSRQRKIAVDKLRLTTTWREQSANDQSIQVRGLLIQGALFDGSSMIKAAQSSPPYSPVPLLRLEWAEASADSEQSGIDVPLYATHERTELISIVRMPCKDVEKWSIAAVALFLK